MEVVQELRAKAYAQGNLTTTSEQKVIVEKETIIIEPADPHVVYVPYYDPFHIYGPWWYPAYPPYYWGPPGVSVGIGISYWPAFYSGFAFGTWSYFDWPHHHIIIDLHKRPRYVRHDRWVSRPGPWYHVPRHRRGVAYRDKTTARRYGQYPYRPRDFRRETRGFPEVSDRDRDRDRRVDDRTRIDRDKGGDDRLRIDRDWQERERVDRGKQRLERVEGERKERERADGDKQIRERTEPDRQMQQRADQQRRARQQVEREGQQRSRDSIFHRIGDGRRERQSSERGRLSRQGRGDLPRDRDRSGGGSREGRRPKGR